MKSKISIAHNTIKKHKNQLFNQHFQIFHFKKKHMEIRNKILLN